MGLSVIPVKEAVAWGNHRWHQGCRPLSRQTAGHPTLWSHLRVPSGGEVKHSNPLVPRDHLRLSSHCHLPPTSGARQPALVPTSLTVGRRLRPSTWTTLMVTVPLLCFPDVLRPPAYTEGHRHRLCLCLAEGQETLLHTIGKDLPTTVHQPSILWVCLA